MNYLRISLLLFIFSIFSCSQDKKTMESNVSKNEKTEKIEKNQELTGEFLGQKTPMDKPEIFALDLVSNGLNNRDVAISPSGDEMYFGLLGRGFATILTSKRINGKWSKLDIAPFSGNKNIFDLEPHISPDGKRLFFLSTRPNDGSKPKEGWNEQDIWAMDKNDDGSWSEPYNLGKPINTEHPEFFPSVTNNGTMYFTRGENGKRISEIYRSRLVDGKYQEPEKLPEQINASQSLWNAAIAPDESYLIVCTAGRDDAIGHSDYYVSFRSQEDKWTDLINLGQPINMPQTEGSSPYITADGKYFFFSSTRKLDADESDKHNYKKMVSSYGKAGNGNSDIYWVSTDFISKLKPDSF